MHNNMHKSFILKMGCFKQLHKTDHITIHFASLKAQILSVAIYKFDFVVMLLTYNLQDGKQPTKYTSS